MKEETKTTIVQIFATSCVLSLLLTIGQMWYEIPHFPWRLILALLGTGLLLGFAWFSARLGIFK